MSDFSTPVPVPQLENEEMTMLQAFLQNLGYGPGPVDGLWGPSTKAAWLKFSNDNGFTSTTLDLELWSMVTGEAPAVDLVEGPGGSSIFDQFGADGGTGQTMSDAGDGVIDAEEEAAIREQYPTLAHLLDDPEIGPVLRKAVKEGWSGAKLMLSLEATEWFQTTSASQREFDASYQRDPASVQADLDRQQLILENLFSVYGVTISQEELEEMAFNVVRNGTSEDGVLREVGNFARAQGKGDTGQFGGSFEGKLAGMVQQLTTMAKQYHLGYSEDQMEEWAVRIVEGRWDFEAVAATLRRQAAAAYPHLTSQIEQGMTLEDFYAPTKNRVAQLLDMNPNDIDLQDDRWSQVTQMIDDNGNVRTMTNSELGRWARQQDEWWSTDAANAETYGVLNGLLKTMGAI